MKLIKFKIFSSHVETGFRLEEHTRMVNDFCNMKNIEIIDIAHNFDTEKIETWFSCMLTQVLITTIKYVEQK